MSTSENHTELTDELETTRTGLSRRSLVRAGANAAWAVPLISVATAAPALAASNAPALTLNESGVQRFSDALVLTAQVTNIGTATTTAPLVLVVSMDKTTGEYAKRPIKGQHTGVGWRQPVVGGPDLTGPYTWTFLWTPKLKVNSSSTELRFVVGVGKNGYLSLTGTYPKTPRTAGGAHVTFNVSSIGAVSADPKTDII